jgi:hypothetical protein
LGSDYFKTRLSRRPDFLERHYSAGEIPILEEHDVSAEAFEKMLEYVYTDELGHLGDDDPLFLSEELLGVASRTPDTSCFRLSGSSLTCCCHISISTTSHRWRCAAG